MHSQLRRENRLLDRRKFIGSIGELPRHQLFVCLAIFREHKLRRTVINDDDDCTGGEDAVSFIDLQSSNHPHGGSQKGILKKHTVCGIVIVDSHDDGSREPMEGG